MTSRGARIRRVVGLPPVALLTAILLPRLFPIEGGTDGQPGYEYEPSAQAQPRATPSAAPARVDVSPPPLEDVEDMCALLTACDNLPIPPSLVPPDFATCVRTMAEQMTAPSAISFSLTMRECGLRSNSCGALRTCALRGARPDVCVGRGKQVAAGYCDIDGRAISCWRERVLAVRDCPRGGEQCSVRDGEASCSLGPCPPEIKEGAPPLCSASGTRVLRCEKGRLASLDCSAFGLRCAAGPSGPGCAAATAACVAGSRRCEGIVAVDCFNGHEVRVDCAAAGLQCPAAAGSSTIGACASAPATTGACDPGVAARCDGASVKYCFAGRPRSYLCKSLGSSRCVSDSRGARCAQ
jgi:hypothetical protein